MCGFENVLCKFGIVSVIQYCSGMLCLVLNVRPVCPMYISLQILHFRLYIPDCCFHLYFVVVVRLSGS
jgi:hypothetical protein